MMKTERTSDDLWTQRTLSTFTTFASRGSDVQNGKIIPNHSPPSHHTSPTHLNGTLNTNFIINGNGTVEQYSTNGNGTLKMSKNGEVKMSLPLLPGTLPRVNGMSKSKPVSVPTINSTPNNNKDKIPLSFNSSNKNSFNSENKNNSSTSSCSSTSTNSSHSRSKSETADEGLENNKFNSITLIPLPKLPTHAHAHSHSLSFASTDSNGDSDYNLGHYLPSEDDEKNIFVTLTLEGEVKRFGFSVIGGLDEGFPPCIDEISSGSPADKADLEVGDEILEVNGRSLEDATHTEVISHIHQCIRSRTICLRVKRRSGNKLALDLASQSNVQDAFVIAVEQQARERLEKLSALKRIKPVDMTKLSHQLSEVGSGSSSETPRELNGLIEAATGSPIYITSVPALSSSQAALFPPSAKDIRRNSDLSSHPPPTSSPSSNTGEKRRVSSEELRQSPLIFNGFSSKDKDTSGSKSSIGAPSAKGETFLSGSSERLGVPTGKITRGENHISPRPKSGGSSPLVSHPNPPLSDSVLSSNSPVQYPSSNNMSSMVEWENGPHREMAVDVPDSFVPRNKTPPRYPPNSRHSTLGHTSAPHPSSGTTNRNSAPAGETPNFNSISFKGENGGVGNYALNGTVGTKSGQIGREKDEWSVNNNYTVAPQVTPRTILSSKVPEVTPSSEQADRIRKYQDELRKRKEVEERQAREDEFLRTSLRGSKKLQALECLKSQEQLHAQNTNLNLTGFVNDAYENYLEDEGPPEILLKKPVGISELVASLVRVQEALKKNGMGLEDTVSAVGSLLKKPQFQQVLAVHNKVQDVWCYSSPPTPISSHSLKMVQECLGCLYSCSSGESAELVDLLTRVDIEGVLFAHDRIAEREKHLLPSSLTLSNAGESVDENLAPSPLHHSKSTPPPPLPSSQHIMQRQVGYGGESGAEDQIKVVRLEKTQEPLGATVRNDGEGVVIGRIVKGGAAERSGLIHEGDEVLEVNGIEMRGKSVNEVCDILSRMTGTLTFLIIPTPTPTSTTVPQRRDVLIHVRAHFDYDPEDDIYLPCRELGIAFSKGDVLHVISQEDPNWWQGHREGEEDQPLAGLIPSKSFQEQRETVKQTLLGETETREKSKRGGTLLCAKTHKKKKKKIPYSTAFNDDFDAEEIPTYEEVALYYPRASFKRPVVLIGPPNIGRHELRQRLMQESDRFAAAVPHTSRSRKEGETDGVDYHFISRSQFEGDILSRKFVEHGEFEKAYYGTSLDAIRSVVNLGRICVLNLHPQSLKILRNSDLKPYIVFVAPPPLERLKQLRISRGESYKEDELIDIIEKAREMEDKYGHYFDLVIINNDVERTYHELVQRINYIEREPQWVPAFWLKQ